MILPLTSLEEAWGSHKNNNIYKSNEPQTTFIKNGHSVTKNDLSNWWDNTRRVDVALYNNTLVKQMENMTSDEKTNYVTNKLLQQPPVRQTANTPVRPNTPVRQTANTPVVEYYRNETNENDDVLRVVTILLVVLLLEKLYFIFKS